MTTVLSTPAPTGGTDAPENGSPGPDLGPAVALSCRECGHRIDLGPFYACTECFGPLEVAYEFALSGAALNDKIEVRPGQHLAVRAAAARSRRRRRHPEHEPGLHQADQGRQPRPRARHEDPVGQGRLGKPHPLVQGPGGRRRVGRRPPAGLLGAGLPVDRQPRQCRGRCRRQGRDPFGGVGSQQPGAAEDPHHCCLWRHAGRRRGQLRRHQPAGRTDRRGAGRLGVRQRQRPALLRRGLQDPRLRGRRTAGLAAPGATRHPDRLRCATGEDRQGLSQS